MGWPGPLFLPCLSGQPGTQNGPPCRAWAEGQARRPVRHSPQGTTCPLGPLSNVSCRPVVMPCRAGPARCPGITVCPGGMHVFRTHIRASIELTPAKRSVPITNTLINMCYIYIYIYTHTRQRYSTL